MTKLPWRNGAILPKVLLSRSGPQCIHPLDVGPPLGLIEQVPPDVRSWTEEREIPWFIDHTHQVIPLGVIQIKNDTFCLFSDAPFSRVLCDKKMNYKIFLSLICKIIITKVFISKTTNVIFKDIKNCPVTLSNSLHEWLFKKSTGSLQYTSLQYPSVLTCHPNFGLRHQNRRIARN